MNYITIGIALYLLFELAKGQYNAIAYSLKAVRVIKWTFTDVTVQFDIELSNDSDIVLNVDGFLGSIYKGVKIADVGLIRPVKAMPHGKTVFTLGAKISYSGAAAGIVNFFETGGNNEVTVKGQLTAGKVNIPVNFTTALW